MITRIRRDDILHGKGGYGMERQRTHENDKACNVKVEKAKVYLMEKPLPVCRR